MMASLNARITAMAVFLALSVTTLSFAAGPTFVSPTDGAIVRGELVVQAEKRPVDGNNSGYVSYRITGQDISAPKADMAVAVIYPFEYSWDTQQTFVNAEDPWDPHNGSRRYPDGLYTITAVAFGQDGKQVGEATKITVTVANGIANPPRNADGRILLQPGGGPEQTVRYAATGELNARLTPVEVENLQHTERPAIAEMKMAAEWRNVVRKPFGPGHTADGKRWHEDYYRDPLRRAMVSTWRDVQYGVIDQYPEEGWVEMLGPALSDLGEDWERRVPNFLPYVAGDQSRPYRGFDDLNLLNTVGTTASAAGAQGGTAGGGMPASPGGGAPMGDEPGMGGGMGAAAGGGTRALDRAGGFAPLNLDGLGRKYRTVIQDNGSMSKLQVGDPRWPLAELWITYPTAPVKEGDVWTGPMTVLPFFDQEFHILVHPNGGSTFGPNHLTPLYHHTRRLVSSAGGTQIVEVLPGGRNGPIQHVLDGFEYYKGYECARIVTRYRNYADPDSWSLQYMQGWRLSDINPRLLATGTNSDSAMVQTDLVRITYFAYRSGHVVGMEDNYFHKMWLNEGGFSGLMDRTARNRLWSSSEIVMPSLSRAVPPYDRATWPIDEDRSLAVRGGAAAGGAGGMMGAGMGVEMPGMASGGMPAGMPGAPMGGGMAPAGMPAGGGMPGAMPGGPGMMGPGMGGEMPGMAGAGGPAAAPGDDAMMTNVVANLTLKIVEEQGSETRNARPKTEYAALPSVNVATPPPGARSTGAEAIRRYIVVEDEGVFYLPESPQLQGKRGVAIDTSADQLIKLGFTPDAAIKF